MKSFIKFTDTLLYVFFKLFSVAFSTYALVGLSYTLYDNTNFYIATAISLPFGWYYAFNWIGHFETQERIKPILISGFFMMMLYLTLVPTVKQYYDNRAIESLSSNIAYTEAKAEYSKYLFDPEKFAEAEKNYNTYKKSLNHSTIEDEESWVSTKTAILQSIKFNPGTKKKSKEYISALNKALRFRNNNQYIKDLPRNIVSVSDIATILYASKLKKFNDLQSKSNAESAVELKRLEKIKDNLSFEHLKKLRAVPAKIISTEETKAKASAYSTMTIVLAILVLGFFVEIVLNALSLWRRIIGKGSKVEAQISTMMTLLNKPVLMRTLNEWGIVHENNQHSGKVFALYATMINIIVMYKQGKKEKFIRDRSITDKDICNFKYLDVSAKRYISSAFALLENRDVMSLGMDDIKDIITTHKNA